MTRGRLVSVSLVVVALSAVACATASPRLERAASAPGVRTIASASTSDFRVVLTAARRGGGSAPTATITLTTSRRLGGGWQRTGVHRLRGTYFWNTVTGPRAVCRLEVRTTGSSARFQPQVLVQLLLSPSLGCGPAAEYDLT